MRTKYDESFYRAAGAEPEAGGVSGVRQENIVTEGFLIHHHLLRMANRKFLVRLDLVKGNDKTPGS